METIALFRQLAISLLLGLLVGLQRERTDSDVAGFRTFPLITVFGTLTAALAVQLGYPWLMGVGFAGIIAITIVGNLPKLRQPEPDLGVTTEIAMLTMFGVGAMLVVFDEAWEVPVAVGVGVAILLHFKPELHGFAAKLGERDFRATLQFVLITFIVLPVLPNRNYDPLEAAAPVLTQLFPGTELPQLSVLNPHEIWLLVVLVVGISLGGYISYKLFGGRVGIVLAGILGGTISSTATTVSYSRQAAQQREVGGLSPVVIMVAGTVTYVRVLIEVAVVGRGFVRQAFGPILAMFLFSLALCAAAWFSGRRGQSQMPEQENPTELKSALLFAVMYAVVLMAVAAGEAFLPNEALYGIAALSGMTDMDAITLSTSRLVRAGRVASDTGWRLIVVGIMSNVFFKGLIVAMLGNRQLLQRIAVLFGLSLLSGFAVLLLWPG